MSVQIQMRRGTAAQWTTANTLLAEGEIGLELDTQKFKMGTGVLAWNSLGYYSVGSSTVTSVNGQLGDVVLNTDDIAEGIVNKYFTDSLARGTVSATGSLSYNSLTGVFSYTQPTNVSTFTNDANYLDNADIGVSVQGYNANTVVDASYVHTDNNYTTTEKSKLAGIAAGAEVNVNADWTAVTGDAVILNKPTLGTAAATASTDYATAAQGALAASALQPASIGVTVQAYDTNLAAWAGVATTDKQDTLVSGTNIKTINGGTLLGSGDLVISGGGGSSALTISNKTAAYTVVAGDLGTIINCTSGTFTVSLTAAATLGAGFNCTIWNTNFGTTITIDPSGAETIEGIDSYKLNSGQGLRIICDGAKFFADSLRPFNIYGGVGIGNNARIGNTNAIAIGNNSNADGVGSVCIFGAGSVGASAANYGTAIGGNSSGSGSKALGSGSTALGGSYASGDDSFAAAVTNSASTYGATGGNSIAIGRLAKASGPQSIVLSHAGGVASGAGSVAIGGYSGNLGPTASAQQSMAVGSGAVAAINGKYAYATRFFGAVGDAQHGCLVLRNSSTSTTPITLVTDAGTAGVLNQVILPNNSAYTFSGLIVARQQASAGTSSAAWEIKGLIQREGSAGTTVLVNSIITVIDNTPGWALSLTANTTHGGLSITAIGAAATNIRWVATIHTSEVTY